MIKKVYKETEERMEKTVKSLKSEFASLRPGRATPALVEKISVDYYGVPTPLNQLANISAPEPRMLVIQPWDVKSISDIEKAILKSDLGINPTNDGKIIRLVIPQLTEERRKELNKVIKKKAEESKVAVRSIRRDANDKIKHMEKNGEISEDDSRRALDEIQKITDSYIQKIDKILEKKEKEIMEV
ncbi:MAG: ribosome recycling factor [Thermosediminibacterales bacterium]|nr:ribosome recycling factor [Thermosediminibacterales bacterium]